VFDDGAVLVPFYLVDPFEANWPGGSTSSQVRFSSMDRISSSISFHQLVSFSTERRQLLCAHEQ
jgi:hypothetical protein